ncbi:MAG: inorganic phosphate transporter, partial [Candidatus Sulfotelmatobacter sp.]
MATASQTVLDQKLSRSPGKVGMLIFGVVLAIGVAYAGSSLLHDLSFVHSESILPYVLLAIALLVALGFEFVNGFHDTANAVATVIYTHSLEPHVAVVWSGFWNFLGVLASSGLVAFAIVSLLPVELILQVGSKAGFAMVFALLVAAIIWNLGTWWFGLPASSSHTLIGSVIGVGIANQLMNSRTATSGVDWGQAASIGKSLLLSPIVGFGLAGLLLLLAKALIKDPKLYQAPEGTEPPPFYIRCLLILTCTGVSFFHGSNDGQKGMGLIMLILIGTVPTAYALNHAVTWKDSQDFIAVSTQAADTLSKYVSPNAAIGDAHDDVTEYIRTKDFTPNTMLALRTMVNDIGTETSLYRELKNVPNDRVRNFRNDMYLISESIRLMQKSGNPQFTAADKAVLANYKKHIDHSTRFIPLWVKVAVAMALGLGTMVGWKRIVITVGEK